MSTEDLHKWNKKYADASVAGRAPSVLLTALDDLLPRRGRALDLAGGGGRHAIWLARRGLNVTLADISDVGLSLARQRAAEAGVTIETQQVDFESDDFPHGPWDLIVSFHFLRRELFRTFPQVLSPGGWLVFVQPTHSNLQRHEKPPAAFLLDDGELPNLIEGLDVIRYEEGWLSEGRHDAFLIARRPVDLQYEPDLPNLARKRGRVVVDTCIPFTWFSFDPQAAASFRMTIRATTEAEVGSFVCGNAERAFSQHQQRPCSS